ncbi:GntR family transcriptional regulator [Alisedimentitalea sp. MJ-SS2]|uniref:GntR family transcriptional regulator n=1 Tax=Aliisedimentitalea sp. MJ-SS2 TaxID=3049795 RepID=UPI00290DDFD1|nr:GntR family transcriptional regulator [Alisedimentitalea sp. MJ-SS2]MDU8927076.1 GntR family transcriptional regulator [Alisedimentitalea sp. MJ-SS2]
MADQVLAENIANQLRRDILRGKFPPGAPIKERDNAAEMGVSRTPMREAIRILAREGLLVLRASRSPIVAKPSFKEISDAVDVLLALENLSVVLACRNASDKDLANLKAIHKDIADRYDDLDPLDLFEIDMSFHSAIAKASHNASLFGTYRSYLERLWRARFLSARQRRNRDRVINHHTALLQALTDRDEAAARAAIRVHLGNLADDIRPSIEEEQD